MKKHLILVKHSLPKIAENLPAREWILSEDGRIRAERLAERLSQYQPEVIVSSVELKAKETAEIIARKHKLKFQVVDGLYEHDRSGTPYLSKNEFQASVREFFEKPDELVFGSETANQSHTRFDQAVDSVLSCHADKTIVIVSHGTVISLFVSRLTGTCDSCLWNELALPSFVVLDMESKSILAQENIT